MALLDSALSPLVAESNPFAALIFTIMKNQIKNDINEFNAYIASHLEDAHQEVEQISKKSLKKIKEIMDYFKKTEK